jgi:hypothetical protein
MRVVGQDPDSGSWHWFAKKFFAVGKEWPPARWYLKPAPHRFRSRCNETLMISLADMIRAQLEQEPPPGLEPVCETILSRFGDAVVGVLFYGSCLNQGDQVEGVVDLYVVVSDYRTAYGDRGSRLLARILPPTVGYLEQKSGEQCIRAKYAVISMRDFRRGTSGRWFHSYLWGRFAQPSLLLAARDEAARDELIECLASAIRTLLQRTLPLAPTPADSVDLWAHALGLSYRAELRPESAERAHNLVIAGRCYYQQATKLYAGTTARLTELAEPGPDGPVFETDFGWWSRWRTRFAWGVRRITGKIMTVARLLKALGTFEGGLDYAVWKLERHTGVRVVLSERTRRRPWLYVWGELFRLYRSGALR